MDGDNARTRALLEAADAALRLVEHTDPRVMAAVKDIRTQLVMANNLVG